MLRILSVCIYLFTPIQKFMLNTIRADQKRMLNKLPTTWRAFTRTQLTSESLFQREMTACFHNSWLASAFATQLNGAGSWLATTAGKYPVILVKKNDGSIGGYHNVCRHKGAVLCEGSGHGRFISCPSHQWTYDVETGNLRKSRGTPKNGDLLHELNLKPVATSVAGGVIFVNPTAEPGTDAGLLSIDQYFRPYGLEQAEVAFQHRTKIKGNWKLVWDANRECLHCRKNHPSLPRTQNRERRRRKYGRGVRRDVDQGRLPKQVHAR